MSRIPLRDVDELPEAFQRLREAEPDNSMLLLALQGLAEAPELYLTYIDWYWPWHRSDPSVPARLPKRLKELLRLRMATFTGCSMCKAARMSDDVVPEELAVGVDRDDADLTDAERTALAFAEKLAIDHFSVDDDDFASLREHFDTAQILELVYMVGVVYIGTGIAMSVLQLDNASCPVPSAAPAWSADLEKDAGLVAQHEFVSSRTG